MRVLDEQSCAVLWQWDRIDGEELCTRFGTNLLRCLQLIKARAEGRDPPPAEQLQELSDELQQAAQTLDECAANCYALAATLSTLSDDSATGLTDMPENQANRLKNAIGKPVFLTRTTMTELQNKIVILEGIDGDKAIIRDRSDYWVTPVDRLIVLAADPPATAGETAETGQMPAETEAPAHLAVFPPPALQEFLDRLNQGTQQAPVVIYTRELDENTRLRFKEAGVTDFAPFPTELVATGMETLAETLHADNAVQPQGQAQMHLTLGQGDLGNALQFLSMTARSGRLEVHFPDQDEPGSVFLDHGSIVHAEYHGNTGIEAVARMLAEQSGDAHFFVDEATEQRTVARKTDQLLVEAAVLADELGANEAENGN